MEYECITKSLKDMLGKEFYVNVEDDTRHIKILIIGYDSEVKVITGKIIPEQDVRRGIGWSDQGELYVFTNEINTSEDLFYNLYNIDRMKEKDGILTFHKERGWTI